MLCVHFIMRTARVCPLFTGLVITRERLGPGTGATVVRCCLYGRTAVGKGDLSSDPALLCIRRVPSGDLTS